jgi:hypothetical protein
MLDAQDHFAIGFILACAMWAGAMLYMLVMALVRS